MQRNYSLILLFSRIWSVEEPISNFNHQRLRMPFSNKQNSIYRVGFQQDERGSPLAALIASHSYSYYRWHGLPLVVTRKGFTKIAFTSTTGFNHHHFHLLFNEASQFDDILRSWVLCIKKFNPKFRVGRDVPQLLSVLCLLGLFYFLCVVLRRVLTMPRLMFFFLFGASGFNFIAYFVNCFNF